MKKALPSKAEYKFTSTLERSDNKLWGCHFLVPKNIAEKLIDAEDRRVVCTINDSVEYQCAILHYGNGRHVISVNKKLRDTLRIDVGSEVQVLLRKDESEYGLPLPEELEELFKQDKEGKKIFHALTPGKQRTLLYIVGSAKSSEKRIMRSIIIVNHLKANKGKIDYKKLTASLKSARM